MQKKLFEQWEIENFLESFDLQKVRNDFRQDF